MLKRIHLGSLIGLFGLTFFIDVASAATLVDDRGHEVTVGHPPARIVSMSPHVTEMLFAIGAGDRMVGADEYSDFPQAARRLTRIGNSSRIDIERVLSLKPDLVIGWGSGNAASDVAKLEEFDIPVYITEIGSLDNIADQLISLGKLVGRPDAANEVAGRFRQRLGGLKARYAGKEHVSVFYQAWDRPLMTVNGRHFISDAIRLCGGVNLFPDLEPLAPTISKEAVVSANPQVIMADHPDNGEATLLSMWGHWRSIDAVKYGNLFTIPSDLIARPTPRILEGVAMICDALERARIKLERNRE